MAEKSEVSSTVDSLPATTPSKYTSPRSFGRERSVHEILGGGKYADVLMWKKKHVTGATLLGATAAYVLFEWSGYTLLSIAANALFFLIVILFLWSTLAALLNRPPPPVPEIQLSEEMVANIAHTLRLELNRGLDIVHVIALGKDYKLFLEVIASLWLFSIVGGLCNLLTLFYIGVVLAHTVPVVYDKYEDDIDKYLKLVVDESKKLCRRADEAVISKIPRAKKVQ